MKKSFTLIELVVVIVIIGILATLMIPQISGIVDDAKESTSTYNARAYGGQLELFNVRNGKYPAKFHTGMLRLGTGYGSLSDAGMTYHNTYNPTNGSQVPVTKAGTPSAICSELSENIRKNLENCVQVPGGAGGPIATSLAKAGISRLIFGEIAATTAPEELVGLGSGATQWNPNDIASNEFKLLNGTFSQQSGTAAFFGANSWADENGQQIVLGGKTIPQYINQPLGDIQFVREVVPLIVSKHVDWTSIYDENGNFLKSSSVTIANRVGSDPENYCVAFFACGFNLIDSKPVAQKAIFIGCVDAKGTPIE